MVRTVRLFAGFAPVANAISGLTPSITATHNQEYSYLWTICWVLATFNTGGECTTDKEIKNTTHTKPQVFVVFISL